MIFTNAVSGILPPRKIAPPPPPPPRLKLGFGLGLVLGLGAIFLGGNCPTTVFLWNFWNFWNLSFQNTFSGCFWTEKKINIEPMSLVFRIFNGIWGNYAEKFVDLTLSEAKSENFRKIKPYILKVGVSRLRKFLPN